MTLTQQVFLFALILFGPLFGSVGAWQSVDPRSSRRAQYVSRLVGFVFCILIAYFGWLIGGLYALFHYPSYPSQSPGEKIAILYTIPGFLSGMLGVIISRFILQTFKRYKIIAFSIASLGVLYADFILFLLAIFPKQD